MAYPLMDVLLLGVAARLALERGNRRPAFHLLILSMMSLLAADTAYGLIVLHGTYNTGSPLDALWIAFYVAWGAAALHPSMQTLSEPAAVVESRLTGWRVVLLVGATLVAPMIQVADSSLGYAPAVLVGGDVAIVVLVIVRTAGLIRRYEGSLIREGALREAGGPPPWSSPGEKPCRCRICSRPPRARRPSSSPICQQRRGRPWRSGSG